MATPSLRRRPLPGRGRLTGRNRIMRLSEQQKLEKQEERQHRLRARGVKPLNPDPPPLEHKPQPKNVGHEEHAYRKGYKTCNTCQVSRKIEEFYLTRKGGHNRSRLCKPCESIKNKHYYYHRRKHYPPQMTGKQQCIKCGTVKPYTEYSPHRHYRTGRRSDCKPCRRKYENNRMKTRKQK